MLRNPGLDGPVAYDIFVYASPGTSYGGVAALNQYVVYDAPSLTFATPRINIAAFANLGSAPWPFANTNVPLNGHVCIPRGRGPFPHAVFVHGNHNPFENSTPGYLYLCELLASHGIIAATSEAQPLPRRAPPRRHHSGPSGNCRRQRRGARRPAPLPLWCLGVGATPTSAPPQTPCPSPRLPASW